MLSSILMVRTGQQCVRCDSLTTTSFWYRAKTCGFADTGYVCSKCYGYLRDRQLGIFKDFKAKKALRRCDRCDSNNTIQKTTFTGYKHFQWYSLKGAEDKWLCYNCWSSRPYECPVICVRCKNTFLTTPIKKYRTDLKCKKCIGESTALPETLEAKKTLPKIEGRFCSNCGSDETRIGWASTSHWKSFHYYWRWYNDGKGGMWCSHCYQHELSMRKILFKRKLVKLPNKPKTGYCSWCSNNIHDKSCKATQIHHIEYHDNDPLRDVIELCASCHRKETIRLSRRVTKKSER